MPRPYVGPKLWLDPRRGTWTILDGRRRLRTGFVESQKAEALAEVKKYSGGVPASRPRPPIPPKPYYALSPPRVGVYVIGYGPYVKIGISLNIDERMAAIQTSAPEKLQLYAIIDGWLAEEKALHRRFAGCRLRGEWFRKEGELEQWINGGCE